VPTNTTSQPPTDQSSSTGQQPVQSQRHVESAASPNQLVTDKIAPSAPSATPVSESTHVITPPVLIGNLRINPLRAALWQMVKTRTVMELKLLIDD
jgi:hypothetical protein